MGKNCQNLLNTGELVVQGYIEEITGKVQKYARMSATQFVPYTYGELTIENIKEDYWPNFHSKLNNPL